MPRISEETKAELRQLEIEFRKKAALNKSRSINLTLADIIAKYLKV